MDLFAMEAIENLKKSGGVGYTERKNVLIIPETTADYIETADGYLVAIPSATQAYYTVHIDGVAYELRCLKNSFYMDPPAVSDAVHYNYDGERFYVEYSEQHPDSITVSVTHHQEIDHPVNAKYLPVQDRLVVNLPFGLDVALSGTPLPADAETVGIITSSLTNLFPLYAMFVVSNQCSIVKLEPACTYGSRASWTGLAADSANNIYGQVVCVYDATAETVTFAVREL